MKNEKCPHLNCLVYHKDGECNCDMKKFCPECKKEKTITIEGKEYELIQDDTDMVRLL